MYSAFSDLDSEGLYALSDQGSMINETSMDLDPMDVSLDSTTTELDDSKVKNEIKADASEGDAFALLQNLLSENEARLQRLQSENDALRARDEERRGHYEQVIVEKNSEIQSLLGQLIQAKLDVAQKHVEFDELEGKCRSLTNALEESRALVLELRSELAEMQSRPSQKLRMSVNVALERIRRKTFT